MGLFSKKKESHTIEEAIKNDDLTFEYTTAKGNTYTHFPHLEVTMLNRQGFDDLDHMFEMFAPNLMRLLIETNQNIKTIIHQNSELRQKCQQLEQEVAELKNNSHQTYQR